MEFRLTPHVKAILCGRGMCKGGRLLCAATNCLYHPKDSPDPDFGRDIEVKGFAICSRCGNKTEWDEGAEWSDDKQKVIMRCKVCHKILPKKSIEWTQWVKSRHRRRKHEYFHKECYDAMFFDPTEQESAHFVGIHNDKLTRIIKWALRVDS